MILKFICHTDESGQIKNHFMNFGNFNDQPPPNGIECELSQVKNLMGKIYSGFLRRKKYDICVPHFLDYCHEIATNQDFDQPNVFDLEDWLFKDRVKNGFWPHIKTMR